MGKKILLVDDTKFMRMLLKNLLVPEGYEIVAEAEDGVQAIEMSRRFKPDLITMDIIMPNLNGIDALKAIMREQPDIPVVMVTALGQEKMVKQAMASGAKGYIIKPFKAPRVLNVLSDVMKDRRGQ